MKYKGNNFKKVLEAFLSKKHNQPISVSEYMHMPDGTVDTKYEYRQGGESRGSNTRMTATEVLETLINYLPL